MVGTFCATCTVAGYPCLFLFSTQNQVPQIIIGIGRVIYHIKTLSVVIQTTLKNLKLISQSREKQKKLKFVLV